MHTPTHVRIRARRSRRPRRERGAALTVALLAGFVVIGAGIAMLTASTATQREHQVMIHRSERRYLAHTGVANAIVDLTAGGTGNLGTANDPIAAGAGSYRVAATDNGDGTMTLTSIGRVGGSSRAIRAVARETTQSVFFHAMYAGNSSGNGAYTLALGGTGTSADDVTGDVYSGGGISISGEASVDGTLRAAGSITGASGETGVHQPPPDIAAMNYATHHDVNVAQAFASPAATYTTSSRYGGTAWQLPETNPAHIFRLNPTDRRTEYQATAKNDYFLEDPYEPVGSSATLDVAHSTAVTLSGVGGEPGVSGNRKVYYIDGNLWIHNRYLYNFAIRHNEAAGVQVTFVVRGNIYFSDNVILENPAKDGVAFIAVKDPNVDDSGNILFGDTSFGTLELMQAFMYAEGDFRDRNLNTAGSPRVQVDGIMSAGDHVSIDRTNTGVRSRLILRFDPRIRDGDLDMPGLPGAGGGTFRRTFQVLTEFEVPAGE